MCFICACIYVTTQLDICTIQCWVVSDNLFASYLFSYFLLQSLLPLLRGLNTVSIWLHFKIYMLHISKMIQMINTILPVKNMLIILYSLVQTRRSNSLQIQSYKIIAQIETRAIAFATES